MRSLQDVRRLVNQGNLYKFSSPNADGKEINKRFREINLKIKVMDEQLHKRRLVERELKGLEFAGQLKSLKKSTKALHSQFIENLDIEKSKKEISQRQAKKDALYNACNNINAGLVIEKRQGTEIRGRQETEEKELVFTTNALRNARAM